MDKDANDWVKNDTQKLKQAGTGGMGWPHPKKAIEHTLWMLSILSVGFMLATLPFTGPNNYLSGEAWILFSMLGICLFGGLAVLVRLFVPTEEL